MATTKNGTLRRSAKPPGYWLRGEFRGGFVDDASLPDGYRRRIATWARAAGQASEEQQALLSEHPAAELSDAQRRAEELAGSEASPMWAYLSADQQRLVRDPSAYPDLRGAGYPLSIGQLAVLTGSTHDQIRHWHDLGLLRARRSKGGHRQFFANAAVRAFFLAGNMPQPYITVLRDISKFEGAPILAGMATLFQESASSFDSSEHDLLMRTAHDLERISVLFAERGVEAK
jgi:hypothetical protein